MTFPFPYPAEPHYRRHGPCGYADYSSYRPWLRDEFDFRCVYCLVRERWGLVHSRFDVDHFRPVCVHPEGATDYWNLVYACTTCNNSKGSQLLPDPCEVLVSNDVRVHDDGTIIATTPDAQRLVEKLGLDNDEYTEFRVMWIGIVNLARRWDVDLFERLMGYPEDLPDLRTLKPPGGNLRPEGIEDSSLERKQKGQLPQTY